MPIAIPMSRKGLDRVAGETLVHITRLEFLASIVIDRQPGSQNIGENCTVHLEAGQGYSVAPFRLLRDYSVLDPYINETEDWGRYLYFFRSDPNWWARLKNLSISPFRDWQKDQKNYGVIRVHGANLVAQAGRLAFARADDKAVVVRGDYTGPAKVTPLP